MTIRDRYESSREVLREIHRYRRRRPMFYRSNVFLHELRVLALVKEGAPFFREITGKKLNQSLLEALALVHDDIEMFDGGLTEPEIGRDARNPKPIRAFREMNGRYKFEVNGIPAIDLQNLYKAQGSEAQLVRYADAFNGFGEAMHECVAGNILFEEPLYGHLTQLVTLRASLPVLEGRTTTHPMFTMGELKRDDIPHWGLHSLESLTRESGYAPYDFWREALIIQGDEYVRTSLTEKKERLREQKEVELR